MKRIDGSDSPLAGIYRKLSPVDEESSKTTSEHASETITLRSPYREFLETMCNTDPSSASALVAFAGMKPALNPENQAPVNNVATLNTFMSSAVFNDYQRFQLYDYAQAAANRLRLTHPALVSNPYGSLGPYMSPVVDGQTGLPYGVSPFVRFDPRSRFVQEEPKPQHSYIGLIAMAILSNPDKKMVLSDIYQYILDNYPYFRNRGPGWRNSIRHNLSLNDCFIKAGRSANGKGHYWAIHPANIDDFKKGDFRRRKAQRKVRKHMGLSVPDDDDSPTPTPPPSLTVDHPFGHPHPLLEDPRHLNHLHNPHHHHHLHSPIQVTVPKRRTFDVESLLAPDNPGSPRSRLDLRPEMTEGLPLNSPSIISHLRSNVCVPRPRIETDDSEAEIDVTEVNQEVEERPTRPEVTLNGQWTIPPSNAAGKPQVLPGKVNPVCAPMNLTVNWPNSLLNYGAFIRNASNTPADLSHAINPLLRRWQIRKPTEEIASSKSQD